jgi:transposase-like protein
MIHHQTIKCPHCSGNDLVKNARSRNKTQRWYCNQCKRSFQLTYRYSAHKPGIKDQIDQQTLIAVVFVILPEIYTFLPIRYAII